jgi:hypothetical protein
MLRKDALRDGPKRQSLLDKAIGPAGLSSLRSRWQYPQWLVTEIIIIGK